MIKKNKKLGLINIELKDSLLSIILEILQIFLHGTVHSVNDANGITLQMKDFSCYFRVQNIVAMKLVIFDGLNILVNSLCFCHETGGEE